MKKCKKCGEAKALSEFSPRASSRDGVRNECRACRVLYSQEHSKKNAEHIKAKRAKHYFDHRSDYLQSAREFRLQKVYGLSTAKYDQLLSAQNGVCALCGNGPGTKRLCVDHDHATGRVRGLLCIQCNSALGKLGDCVESLQKAIRYLQGE